MNLIFTKVNDTKYLLANYTEVYNKAKVTVDELSYGKVSSFEEHINNYLMDNIISRIVSSNFIATFPEAFTTVNFATIDIQLPDRVLVITTGITTVSGETKHLNGVLYR